jgi:hypothetical protein
VLLPPPRGEIVHLLRRLHADALQDIDEVGVWIDGVQLACRDYG